MKIIVMGVSGSGKTTIGKMLAEKLQYPFFDADDYHPKENVEKMKSGVPLEDEDRRPWLYTLFHEVLDKEENCILACSALKESYRKILNPKNEVKYVFLDGSATLIHSRLAERKEHFMPKGLLESQIKTLETPTDAIVVDIALEPEKAVEFILLQM